MEHVLPQTHLPADETPKHVPAMSGEAPTSTELAERRTGMAFQRTRLSAERTLMSTIRTSLSLIGFGFTIFQFFRRLKDSQVLAAGSAAPRHFGSALVLLGIGMLVLGIGYHLAFMRQLRVLRSHMAEGGILHAESSFPVSLTVLVALALLVIGLLAIASMVFRAGPFG